MCLEHLSGSHGHITTGRTPSTEGYPNHGASFQMRKYRRKTLSGLKLRNVVFNLGEGQGPCWLRVTLSCCRRQTGRNRGQWQESETCFNIIKNFLITRYGQKQRLLWDVAETIHLNIEYSLFLMVILDLSGPHSLIMQLEFYDYTFSCPLIKQ